MIRTLLATAAAVILLGQPAKATISCTDRGCLENKSAKTSLHVHRSASRHYRRSNRSMVPVWHSDKPAALARVRESTPSRGGLTTICAGGECGTVVASAADKFLGLFQDLKAMGYRLAPGCYSPSGHMPNSLHHWGGACDLFGQYGRDQMKLPHPGPSEQIALAAKHGLTSGCEWGNRDCGHFDLSGYHGGGHTRVASSQHHRHVRYAWLH